MMTGRPPYRSSLILALGFALSGQPVSSSPGEMHTARQPVHAYQFDFDGEPQPGTRGGGGGGEPSINPFENYTHLGTDFGFCGPGRSGIESRIGSVHALLPEGQWAGLWHSLAGLVNQPEKVLDFTRCFPAFIRPDFQPRCTGLYITARGLGNLKLQVSSSTHQSLWQKTFSLAGGDTWETFQFPVDPENLQASKFLNWIAEAGADLEVSEVGLLIEKPSVPPSEWLFLTSYAKLARCYSAETDLVSDRAHLYPGNFVALPPTGMFVLATAAAETRGIVDRKFAVDLLEKIARTVGSIPRASGLLPHFVNTWSDTRPTIHPQTEFSTVDTSLYYHSMLLAAEMLDVARVVQQLHEEIARIDLAPLKTDDGFLSHGLLDDGETPIPSIWKDWGGETALVLLLEQMSPGTSGSPMMDTTGEVYQGVGFIAEIQSLFYPHFDKTGPDAVSGVDWRESRKRLLSHQRRYFTDHWPDSAAAKLGLYGLSAGDNIPGRGYIANGTKLPGVRLIHPHYLIMSAPLLEEPAMAYTLVSRMEETGLLPPWGLVENADADLRVFTPMNGSLNAAYECISSYHLWARAEGFKDTIYEASSSNTLTATAIQVFYPDTI